MSRNYKFYNPTLLLMPVLLKCRKYIYMVVLDLSGYERLVKVIMNGMNRNVVPTSGTLAVAGEISTKINILHT